MPIRRPRGPKPAFKHLAFLEAAAERGNASGGGGSLEAAFLTLRLIDEWMRSGALLADPSFPAHAATRAAIDALDGDREAQAALRRIIEGIALLQEPDAQPILPRVYAFASLLELRGDFLLAADAYLSVTRYVDTRAHGDLAFDAFMRRGFCLRTAGALEDAERAYEQAGELAARLRNRARVLYARIGLAKISWSRGDLPSADNQLTEVVDEARTLGDERLLAVALHDSASLARLRGDLPRAVNEVFESLKHTSGDHDRERVLSDLGNFLGLAGAWDAARAALTRLEAEAKQQEIRWSAQMNLMDLAAREGSETRFEHYRRTLMAANLPQRLEAIFLRDAGCGLLGFGRRDEARTALDKALAAARAVGTHQVEFQIQEILDQLETMERRPAGRPSAEIPLSLTQEIELTLGVPAGSP